jgi:hypothetical protein
MARLGRLWALCKKGKRETDWAVCRKEKGLATGPLRGRKGDLAQGSLGKIEYLFLFSNLFTIHKPIWIQIDFNISRTSMCIIKYKRTSPPKEKYASTCNATNIIIYLYK